jgi:hypothetical protein
MGKPVRVVLLVTTTLFFLSGCQILRRRTPPGALRISSQPPATVYLEGIDKGTTPFYDEQLEPGEYLVRLSSDQGEWVGKVKVVASAETVVSRELAAEPAGEAGEVITVEPGTGLAVIAEPNGAVVILDGKEVGQTPWVENKISPGEHVLVLRLPGYRERRLTINARNGYRLTVNMELAAKGAAAKSSPPPGGLPTSTPLPLATVAPEPSGPAVIVKETGASFGLRVRSGPGLSYPIVTNVKPGEVFPLLEERSGWIKIRLPDGGEGWASARYLTRR